MKVLNVSYDDYANFAHDNAKALRAAGIICVDVKTQRHAFKYPSESAIHTRKEIKRIAQDFDIIQVFHSSVAMLDVVKDLGKRIIVYHTGTAYRDNPDMMNQAFNPYVDLSIIALGEFAGLGAKNEHYVVGAVDCDVNYKKPVDDMRIIGHFPSNPEVKGTKDILRMLISDKIKHDFELHYTIGTVDYQTMLKNLEETDVYIELFKPTLNGKKYGSFGITALEAAARGKIVVTQNRSFQVYNDNYGYCPLMLIQDESHFVDSINDILSMSKNDFIAWKNNTRKWIVDNHSYIATGRRIAKILGI